MQARRAVRDVPNYLRASGRARGLLLNFRATSLAESTVRVRASQRGSTANGMSGHFPQRTQCSAVSVTTICQFHRSHQSSFLEQNLVGVIGAICVIGVDAGYSIVQWSIESARSTLTPPASRCVSWWKDSPALKARQCSRSARGRRSTSITCVDR